MRKVEFSTREPGYEANFTVISKDDVSEVKIRQTGQHGGEVILNTDAALELVNALMYLLGHVIHGE